MELILLRPLVAEDRNRPHPERVRSWAQTVEDTVESRWACSDQGTGVESPDTHTHTHIRACAHMRTSWLLTVGGHSLLQGNSGPFT